MSDREIIDGNDTESTNSKDKGPPRKRRRTNEKNSYGNRKKSFNSKDQFRRPPISELKSTHQAFLQNGPCVSVAPKLGKCRECRLTVNQRSKDTSNIFCRFYAFRKLKYTKNGQLAVAGFSDPVTDPSPDDLKLWRVDTENCPNDLDLAQAHYLLSKLADLFCILYEQEIMAKKIHDEVNPDEAVAWKRVVKGVREMCDVCETTLFNYHWACRKCGFVVCIDCFKARNDNEIKIWNHDTVKDRDEFGWLHCPSKRGAHDQKQLMLTQVIAGDALNELGHRIHSDRFIWDIQQYCGCALSKTKSPEIEGIDKELIKSILTQNKAIEYDKLDFSTSDSETTIIKKEKNSADSALNSLNDSIEEGIKIEKNDTKAKNILENEKQECSDYSSDDSSSDEDDKQSTLRDLLIGNINKSPSDLSSNLSDGIMENDFKSKSTKKSHNTLFREMMEATLEPGKKYNDNSLKLGNNNIRNGRHYIPIRVMTLSSSQRSYPNVRHMWYCNGKLLRLLDPNDPNNVKIFQHQWKRGQPVLVSNVHKQLTPELWRPESFSYDFGEDANDLVNCLNGALVPNQPMKRFWDGFDYVQKRIKDDNGEPMLLKLKDWPPGEDFAETLPTRFADLMKSLPLGDYTKRNGKFNLASRLPDDFVKPDLGPKMYNAYGSAKHLTKGTTNLHLDISDAVNVMVYVGIPKDIGDDNSHLDDALRAVEESGCDMIQLQNIKDNNQHPGALWHIYAPRDANKIRDMLNKIAIERGVKLEPNHDAIHDQSWYLDKNLRERLYKEYGVEGYTIAQCLGDSVFIPAGAPHQVRNISNCIKVAEDFVSPENVIECFHLTNEFRSLSETHSNHEDKLQIKNIIYHAIKDALCVLSKELEIRTHKNVISKIKEECVESNENDSRKEIEIEQNENLITEKNIHGESKIIEQNDI